MGPTLLLRWVRRAVWAHRVCVYTPYQKPYSNDLPYRERISKILGGILPKPKIKEGRPSAVVVVQVECLAVTLRALGRTELNPRSVYLTPSAVPHSHCCTPTMNNTVSRPPGRNIRIFFEICDSDSRARYTYSQTNNAVTFDWPLPTMKNDAGSVSRFIRA